MFTSPYILLFLCESEENYQLYEPAKGYKVVFYSKNYDAAKSWLLENEYEPIEGKLLAAELV